MHCIQCGTDNAEGVKYCISCNAMMPVAAPVGNPEQSNINIDETVNYLVPETNYQSPILQHLAWSVHEFIEEEAEFEPVVEAYEAFREIFEGFKEEIPKLEDLCYSQQGALPDDPVPSQMRYLMNNAESLFTDGETLFETYLESLEELDDEEPFPEPEPLIEGTKKWIACNNNVCMVFDLLVERTQLLDELIEEFQEEMEASGQNEPEAQPVPVDHTEVE